MRHWTYEKIAETQRLHDRGRLIEINPTHSAGMAVSNARRDSPARRLESGTQQPADDAA